MTPEMTTDRPLRWGIIGVGRAGRARARAIQADPRGSVQLGFRGSPEAAGLQPARSVAALLEAVDAVAICSTDETHYALTRQALLADCHVVCEYPLAHTAAEARELLALAAARKRLLHVEHIELLGSAASWWRKQDLGPITGGRVRFTSSRSDVSAVDGGLARLHRVVDFLGAPEALFVTQRSPSRIQGKLRWPEHTIDLDFHSSAAFKRHTELTIDCQLGQCRQSNRSIFIDDTEVTLPPGPGLFALDQLTATARIFDATDHYLSDARILAVLALRDALREAEPGRWEAAVGGGAERVV